LLGYALEGKKGASHIAARARDARHLLGFVRMIGDTGLSKHESRRSGG